MIIVILIIGYILNVFLTRWINKIAYKKKKAERIPFLWFIPIITFMVLLFIIYIEDSLKKDSWFSGKNW